MYYRPKDLTLLMVYVDDFKMSGPQEGVKASWEAIKAQQEWNKEDECWEQAVILGEIEDVKHFLGCDHKVSEATKPDGTKVNVMTYSMHKFMRQCLERYQQVIGKDVEIEEKTHHLLMKMHQRTR